MSADLELVADFREATRILLRDESLSDDARAVALRRLRDRAKRESSPMAAWCLRAVVEEIGWSHERAEVMEQRTYGERLERAHRQLRARGYSACPTCESALSSELDWSLWRQQREAAIAEAKAKEGAVA